MAPCKASEQSFQSFIQIFCTFFYHCLFYIFQSTRWQLFVISFSAVYSICDMWQIKLLFGEFFNHFVYFLFKNYKRSLKGHVFELFHPGCLYSIYLAPKRSTSCFSVVSKSKAQPTCYFQTSRGTCLESKSSHRSPNPLATFKPV